MNHPSSPKRSILHVDMDSFFASIEQRDHPELRGKPVLVGYDGPRGVVAAASYEARQYGCHSAQPMSIAKKRCKHAIIMPVRRDCYRNVSKKMFTILDSFSPVIEPLSIDEAFLDITGTERALGTARHVAQQIKLRIRRELNLVASIGVAPNKFLAKLASEMEKPDGLTLIDESMIDTVLLPLPVTRLWGVGAVTAEKLARIGIRTIADLRACSPEAITQYFGVEGQRYLNMSHGLDDRPVVPDREAKSISHEHTFEVNLENVEAVRQMLLSQTEQVARRLRKHQMVAKCISIKIRFGDFKTISRSKSLERATNVTTELWQAADEVFGQWQFQPVRLIGITAERLSKREEQAELFSDPIQEREMRLDEISDLIIDKFGRGAIKRGGMGENEQ